MNKTCSIFLVAMTFVGGAVFAETPVAIPQAKAIVIDGKVADWEAIKPVPVRQGSPCVKLAWAYDQGLYGLVQMEDATITGDDEKPYAADSIEIFIESDNQKAAHADSSACAMQVVIGIPTSGKEGPATVRVCYGMLGHVIDNIKAEWVKTATGYVIEFQLMVGLFAPVEIEFERKLGFDFAVNDNGKKVVVFQDCVKDGRFRKPRQWGTLLLAK